MSLDYGEVEESDTSKQLLRGYLQGAYLTIAAGIIITCRLVMAWEDNFINHPKKLGVNQEKRERLPKNKKGTYVSQETKIGKLD
jgi:hypothetical protein